jgi:eukaryotic-like serine/threonine-protein kinase
MTNGSNQLYRFGLFGLDPRERVLLRDGHPVPLPPKAFDMLLVLVENYGHVVEKGELMKRVWAETFVEEANLSYHVFTLRKALGDDKDEPRYIETIPRRGYRFVAEVTEAPDRRADKIAEEHVPVHNVVAKARSALEISQPTGTEPPSALPPWHKASAVVIVIALAAGYVGWMLKPEIPRAITRLEIALGDETFTPGPSAPLALSPDGTRLAYTANNRLYVRALDQLESRPIPGVDSQGLASARGPFFSPDGRWIGFWEAGALRKVSISGGAPVTICALSPPPYSATWEDDNTILIGHGPRGIWRVSGNGGTPERIITVEEGQRVHRPQMLPDGRSVLFTLVQSTSWDEAHIVVQSLDTGTRRPLIGGTDARYLPTGHLVYALRDSVLGVKFDTAALSLTGTPLPLVEGVRRGARGFAAAAHYTVSASGTLSYVESNKLPAARRTLVWVNRRGGEVAIPAEPRSYVYPRLAPDGNRLAVDVQDDNWDIWVWDFTRGRLERVISDPTLDTEPVWTRDGQRLIFLSGRSGMGENLFWQAANGTGTAERLTVGSHIRGADTTTLDGKGLVLRESDGNGQFDLTLLDLQDPAQPASSGTRPLVSSPFLESNGEISPNGKWLAYQSNSTGAFEIYVRPFPDTAQGKWPVSSAGGTEPLWARDGRELFYRSSSGAVMRVPISPGPIWKAGAPTQLFGASSYALGGKGNFAAQDFAPRFSRTYDVSLDGQRFLMIKDDDAPATTAKARRIIVVQNWFEELKSKLPSK